MYSVYKPYGTEEEIKTKIYNILTYNIHMDIYREKEIYEKTLNYLMHQKTLPDNFLTSLMKLPLLIQKTIKAGKKGGYYNYKKKISKSGKSKKTKKTKKTIK